MWQSGLYILRLKTHSQIVGEMKLIQAEVREENMPLYIVYNVFTKLKTYTLLEVKHGDYHTVLHGIY